MKIAVSACLLGRNCKYNGGNNRCQALLDLLEGHEVVPYCPEGASGLPTPRPPAEIQGGDGGDVVAGRARVVLRDGADVTEAFLDGARRMAERARGCSLAVLKANSPSCGSGTIYDGRFTGVKRPGDGVGAALIKAQGIPVFTENDLPQIVLRLQAR